MINPQESEMVFPITGPIFGTRPSGYDSVPPPVRSSFAKIRGCWLPNARTVSFLSLERHNGSR